MEQVRIRLKTGSPRPKYSEAFKKQVREFEQLNKDQLQRKYGLGGKSRVLDWRRSDSWNQKWNRQSLVTITNDPHESNHMLTPDEMHQQDKLKPKAWHKKSTRTIGVPADFYLRFNINNSSTFFRTSQARSDEATSMMGQCWKFSVSMLNIQLQQLASWALIIDHSSLSILGMLPASVILLSTGCVSEGVLRDTHLSLLISVELRPQPPTPSRKEKQRCQVQSRAI